MRISRKRSLLLLIALGAGIARFAQAEPNLNGETGYINMPNGRVEPDGTFRIGDSFAKPYSPFGPASPSCPVWNYMRAIRAS